MLCLRSTKLALRCEVRSVRPWLYLSRDGTARSRLPELRTTVRTSTSDVADLIRPSSSSSSNPLSCTTTSIHHRSYHSLSRRRGPIVARSPAAQRRDFVMTLMVKYWLTPWLRKQRNRVDTRRLNDIGAEMLCAEWATQFACVRPAEHDRTDGREQDARQRSLVIVHGKVRFHGIPYVYQRDDFLPRPMAFVHCRPLVVEMVDCSYMDVTDEGVRHVIFLSRLRELRLSHCEFITNKSMAHLAMASRTLLRLSISGCKRLTSECIGCIGRLTQLEVLDLRETRLVSDADHLRRALPQCELIL